MTEYQAFAGFPVAALDFYDDLEVDNTKSYWEKHKATYDNDDRTLWPGEFVNARLLLETRNDVLTIPPTAVQRGPNGVFTWLVTERGTVQMRPLKLGPTSGNDVIVESGLETGDRVVTEGQYKLQQNIPVVDTSPQPAQVRSAT